MDLFEAFSLALNFALAAGNHLQAMRHARFAHAWGQIIILIFCSASTFAQGIMDVSQTSISGSGFPSQLGDPFGQTFRPTAAGQLGGVVVGIVNVNTPAPLAISLFLSDSSGALIGSPIASGSLTAQEVAAFATLPAATPVLVYIPFDTPYSQSPGESLAFMIDQNPLAFYYGSGNSYPAGQMLGDPSKDLLFSTILVPEPSPLVFLAVSPLLLLCARLLACGRSATIC